MDKPDLLKKEKQDLYKSISVYDSSDEEDEVESYDIINQIRQFKLAKAEAKKEVSQDIILSFISHAAGIYTLYSPVVQKRYYELKKDLLLTELEFKSDDAIKEEIEKNIKKITQFAFAGTGLSGKQQDTVKDILERMKKDMLKKIVQIKSAIL